jgi:hypothetical protein
MTRSGFAIHAALLALAAAASFVPSAANAADEPGKPETIKVASAEAVAEGAAGERRTTFTLVHTDEGACYAIAPPGGEGLDAGAAYIVVPASDVDDALRQKLAKDHPDCKLVDVVARSVSPPR